jgi:glycosyltransferase involved in cell wall biosynthesis
LEIEKNFDGVSMRILNLFTQFHATDGIASYTVTLSEALKEAGCEVSFLSGELDFTEETQWKVSQLQKVCKSFLIDKRLFLGEGKGIHAFRDAGAALSEYVKREAPDIIHLHGRALWPLTTILRILRILPPCVTTVHVEPDFLLSLPKRLASRALCGDRIIAISSDMKKPLAEKMGIPSRKIDAVPHGVDVSYFMPPTVDEKRAARAQFGLLGGDPVACYLGRFSVYKGIDVVIKGVAEAVKSVHNLCLIIAGEGPEQVDLERLIAELNVKKNVRFLGRQEARSVCWAADFILLGSTREGFALSIAEGMACGVIPLRTPSAGYSDQVEHGINGYVIPFGDYKALGKHLVELCRDSALREKLAMGALQTARANLSETAMAKATLEVYKRAIKTSR